MSSALLNRIWDHYPEGGGELLTALALAEHADPDGTNCWPSVKTIATMTRQSERTVQYHFRKLQERGWLLVTEAGGGRNRPTRYRMPVERIPQDVLGTPQRLHRLVDCHETAQELHPIEPETPQALHPLEGKGCKYGANTVQFDPLNGATAIAPDLVPKTMTKEKPTRQARRTIPADFSISDGIREWATKQGYAPFLQAHFDFFVDFAKSNGKTYDDWGSAFRNCIRSDWGGIRKAASNGGRNAIIAPADTRCRASTGNGEHCGMPGERDPVYGYVCAHHRQKRIEQSSGPIPDAVRKQLGLVKKRAA